MVLCSRRSAAAQVSHPSTRTQFLILGCGALLCVASASVRVARSQRRMCGVEEVLGDLTC
jgi:hypothetical protein